MASIKRCLVQARMSGEFDTDILRRKCFDVNMRLYRDNDAYRTLILNVTRHMTSIMGKEFTDYERCRGISGANIGIPFNIIGIRMPNNLVQDGKQVALKGSIWYLLNPRIAERSTDTKVVSSNCGSVVLPKPIKVERALWVVVEYYNIAGKKLRVKVDQPTSFTVQHEVEHNLGILITDKEYEDEESKDQGSV